MSDSADEQEDVDAEPAEREADADLIEKLTEDSPSIGTAPNDESRDRKDTSTPARSVVRRYEVQRLGLDSQEQDCGVGQYVDNLKRHFEFEKLPSKDESPSPEVTQFIRIVISKKRDNETSTHSNDAINQMVEIATKYQEANCLLVYCGINVNSKDIDFQKGNKHYRSVFVAYKIVSTMAEVVSFFSSLSDHQLSTKNVTDLLNGMQDQDLVDRINVIQAVSKPFHLKPIKFRVENDVLDRKKPPVYRNLHIPATTADSFPRAMILCEDKDCMKKDSENLKKTFENIGYETESHTCSGGRKIKDFIPQFVYQDTHGDSSILAILTHARTGDEAKTFQQLTEAAAGGTAMAGKPRLIIIQAWSSNPSETSPSGGYNDGSEFADHAESSAARDAAFAARHMGRTRTDSHVLPLHSHSGVIAVYVKTASDSKNGSPFITALCKVFKEKAASLDVVSMLSLINEELKNSNPSAALASWTMQSRKLFYLAHTGDTVGEEKFKIPDQKKGPKTNVAAVVTDKYMDSARNYQMYLEAVGFDVYTEVTSNLDRIEGIVSKIAERKATVSIVLIVTKDSYLQEVVNQLNHKSVNSGFLLIYCQYSTNSTMQTRPDDSNRLSIALKTGTFDDVEKFVDKLLENPRSEKWSESCLAGADLSKIEPDCEHFQFWRADTGSEDKLPWQKKIPAMVNFWSQSSGFDPKVEKLRENAQKAAEGEGEKKEVHVATDADKKSLWPDSQMEEKSRAKKVLIISNVLFVRNQQRARHASMFDCQRLVDTFAALSYDVATRANLTKEQFGSAIQEFVKDKNWQVIVIMSHGRLNKIVCTDGYETEEQLLQWISESKATTFLPKLVIIQACRNPTSEAEENEPPALFSLSANFPLIVGHSTSPSNTSYLNQNVGSRFIVALCQSLNLYTKDEDLLTIATRVNYTVSHLQRKEPESVQQPWWFVHRVTQRKFLNQQNKEKEEEQFVSTEQQF